MMQNQLRYFMYLRKSTDEKNRQVRSLADQRAELELLAGREHLQVIEVFEEKRTAKVPGRTIFNEMLQRIENGEADAILAWHPDRLARNSVDSGRIIQLVDEGIIQTLTFANYWFEPTSQGKFGLSMAFGQSKYYVDNLSEVIRRGQRNKLINGLWPGRAPIGYRHDSRTKGIKPDRVQGPRVTKLFERYALGDITLSDLTDEVNAWGLRSKSDGKFTVSMLHRMLSNPVYHGLLIHKGEVYAGKHKPLISKQLFERVQQVQRNRGKARRKSCASIHPLRGMFRCGECGHAITMETQKGHIYLRCTKSGGNCSQRYTREEEIHKQVAEAIKSFSLSKGFASKLLATAAQLVQPKWDERLKRQATLHAESEKSEQKLERLNQMHLDEQFTLVEYRKLKEPIVTRQLEIQQQLANLSNFARKPLEPIESFIDQAVEAYFLSQSNNFQKQCDFLKSIASNRQILDKQIKLLPFDAWKTLAQYGPFRNPAFALDRVSEPIEGDVLKCGLDLPLLERTFASLNDEARIQAVVS